MSALGVLSLRVDIVEGALQLMDLLPELHVLVELVLFIRTAGAAI